MLNRISAMARGRRRLSTGLSTGISIGAMAFVLAACASSKHESMTSEDLPLPAHDNLNTVMRSKTAWAGSLLEAVAMRDYDRVETNAEALRKLSQDSSFLVQDTLSYRTLAEEFRQEVTLLGTAAKRRDQADVETAYQRVTSACFRCHSYVGSERFQSSMPGRAGM